MSAAYVAVGQLLFQKLAVLLDAAGPGKRRYLLQSWKITAKAVVLPSSVSISSWTLSIGDLSRWRVRTSRLVPASRRFV